VLTTARYTEGETGEVYRIVPEGEGEEIEEHEDAVGTEDQAAEEGESEDEEDEDDQAEEGGEEAEETEEEEADESGNETESETGNETGDDGNRESRRQSTRRSSFRSRYRSSASGRFVQWVRPPTIVSMIRDERHSGRASRPPETTDIGDNQLLFFSFRIISSWFRNSRGALLAELETTLCGL